MSSKTLDALPASRNTLRLYWLEAKTELLKAWRLPIYSIFTLAFPLMFYVIFGLVFGGSDAGPVGTTTYMLGSYGAFGVIGAALFGFGVGVASERGQGWMRLKRAAPMPPLAYFVAKFLMALVFGALVVLGLFALGATVGEVRLPFWNWLTLFGTLLSGVFPFCALGLALGYLVGPNSAPAVVNLIYLPLAFVSGLWVPIFLLPDAVQTVAPWLPAYHYAQLAFAAIGAGDGSPVWQHAAVLVMFTLLFLGVALWAYRRDAGKTYG